MTMAGDCSEMGSKGRAASQSVRGRGECLCNYLLIFWLMTHNMHIRWRQIVSPYLSLDGWANFGVLIPNCLLRWVTNTFLVRDIVGIALMDALSWCNSASTQTTILKVELAWKSSKVLILNSSWTSGSYICVGKAILLFSNACLYQDYEAFPNIPFYTGRPILWCC